jgi:hypothetical protein
MLDLRLPLVERPVPQGPEPAPLLTVDRAAEALSGNLARARPNGYRGL